ncbi:MAG TPA: SLC13 family permease [Polyangiaceae bacterium]|nr:SLC13 family permease [Polyangiaceae bacterium]
MVNPLGILIFILIYVLISLRRLSFLNIDRPAAALLGAVLCVVCRVLTPAQAGNAVDGSTLLLLLGVMGMGAFLWVDGFFEDIEANLVAVAKTPRRLIGYIVWGSGLLSAFVTNDAVCVLGAPLLVRLIKRRKLEPMPFLLALATAANTGSAATLVGNPQNMLCGLLGGLSYREHLVLVGPVAVVGLAVNHGLLLLLYRSQLIGSFEPRRSERPWLNRRTGISFAVIALTALAYTFGAHLAWAAATGFVAMMLIHRHDTRLLWGRIDWSILLFFAGLFVVVEALLVSGGPAWFFARFPLHGHDTGLLSSLRLAVLFLVGSNIVSNVPFILVVKQQMATLPDPRLGWEILAMASTFAGNLTLLGSVANIIVAENARELGGIGFWSYLKLGFPVALITTLFGTLYLVFAWY